MTWPSRSWRRRRLALVAALRPLPRVPLSPGACPPRPGARRLLQWLRLDRAARRKVLPAAAAADAGDAAAAAIPPGRCRRCCRRRARSGPRVGLFLGCVADAFSRKTNLGHGAGAAEERLRGVDVRGPRAAAAPCTTTPAGRRRPSSSRAELLRRHARPDRRSTRSSPTPPAAGRCSRTTPTSWPTRRTRSRRGKFAGEGQGHQRVPDGARPGQADAPAAAARRRTTTPATCATPSRSAKQPRQLLEMIPGLELVPLPESELCCGAAGSYNLTQPEMAERLGQRKAKNILATGPQAVFTGNVGCLMQIGRTCATITPTSGSPTRSTPCGRAIPVSECNHVLVPRLCLGTHCREALPRRPRRRWVSRLRLHVREAEPRGQCVPRQSLGTRRNYFGLTSLHVQPRIPLDPFIQLRLLNACHTGQPSRLLCGREHGHRMPGPVPQALRHAALRLPRDRSQPVRRRPLQEPGRHFRRCTKRSPDRWHLALLRARRLARAAGRSINAAAPHHRCHLSAGDQGPPGSDQVRPGGVSHPPGRPRRA